MVWRALLLLAVLASAHLQAHAQAALGARATTRAEPEAGAERVTREEVLRSAGTLGEPARALSVLPGVARSSFDSGELVIWGSSAKDHRVYVDGIEIPTLFHAGGVRTTVHPALIESVALTPAAAGAEHGRANGSAIELETGRLRADKGVELAADFIDTSVAAHTTLGPVRGLWAGRIGYLDRLQSWLAPDTREVVAVPAYADGAMRLQGNVNDRGTLTATWLGSHDLSRVGNGAEDPSLRNTRLQTRDFQTAWLRYAQRYRDGARTTLSPFVGVHRRIEALRFDNAPAAQMIAELRYGVRASYAVRRPLWTLRVGLDGAAVSSAVDRLGSLDVPPREEDIRVFGEPPGDDVASDHWATHDVNLAPHVSVRARLGPLTVTPGLRLETFALSTSRATPRVAGTPAVGASSLHVYPEPRLEASVRVAPVLSIAARAGLHHQAPRAEDRSAVFGGPSLGVARSQALALGPSLQLESHWKLELLGFYKHGANVVVRSRERPAPLAGALTDDGRTQSYGAQLSVERRIADGLSAQLAYTLSRSRIAEGDGAYHLSQHDQTHVLSALLGYADAGTALGVRARLSSGSLRPEVNDAFYNVRDDRYEPLFGGNARLPVFFALDVHAEHTLVTTPVRWSLYLDVLNATNHENVEEIAYSHDYSVREDVVGWPTLAVLGTRLEL